MSTAEKQHMTREAYLAFEAASETKHEFVNGEVVAMAGASMEHLVVQTGVMLAVSAALGAAGNACLVLSSDTRVRVDETGLYTYPDVTVVCGPPEVDESEKPPSLLNPRVIFEVLSESTEAHDRGAKFAHYRNRASLQEYVLVSTTARRVELFRRAEDKWWKSAIFEGDESLPLASLGVEVPLSAIYAQLDLLQAEQ